MQTVKYLFALAILLASCGTIRKTSLLPAVQEPPVMVYSISPAAREMPLAPANPDMEKTENNVIAAIADEPVQTTTATATAKTAKTKITSFAQMKEMARTGELIMSKKELRTLNKLDKQYKGNFQQFRNTAFEFTDKAKIVAGVGILGLLLAIFLGSAFGIFLFILAALAFILRYFDVIAF